MRSTAWWVKIAAVVWVAAVFAVHYRVLLGRLTMSLGQALRPGP